MNRSRLRWAAKEAATLYLKVISGLAAIALPIWLLFQAIESHVVRRIILAALLIVAIFAWAVWGFYNIGPGPSGEEDENQHTP